VLKRLLVGPAGGDLVALVYSPWGKEPGSQINPSITLAFLRLGKMHLADALIYIGAHFAGAILGVAILPALMGSCTGASGRLHRNQTWVLGLEWRVRSRVWDYVCDDDAGA
jgi:glycerol uptake facilitator-like aquaporin